MNEVNRRQFVRDTVTTAAAASAAHLLTSSTLAAEGESGESAPQPPVGAFTKSFQDRSIPEVCRIFKQMGLDGLDLTVRRGGHIDPKDVATKLPEAAQAAKAVGTKILFLTTGITDADADAYVAEQVRLGVRMGASPLPDTADALTGWLVEHPCLGPSPAGADAVRFLAEPPLNTPVRLAYRIIHDAAAATVPTPVLDVLGIRRRPGAVLRGRLLIRALRAALGASPAWAAALERCGEPRPDGVRFRNAPGTSC